MNHIFFAYSRRFFIISTLLFGLSAVFCYGVDPFSVYGKVYFKEGKVVNSPAFSSQIQMGKAIGIKQYKPDTLILGSSRTDSGFSPKITQEFLPDNKVYNGAYPGMTIYEVLRYFQHANASTSLKQVFIGLDFFQFHGSHRPNKGFSEERLAVDFNNTPSENNLNDLQSTLFSGDALFYSIKALTGLNKWKKVYLPNGFKTKGYGEGWIDTFSNSEEKYVHRVYTTPNFTFVSFDKKFTTFDYFRKIIQLAYDQGIVVNFFISPSHARQWELIKQLGLWDKWEHWKREMLAITEQESRAYQKSPFLIYDFSTYNKYSTEAVPRATDTPMTWYADSSHYSQALGHIIFNNMMNGVENNFGQILKTETVGAHIKAIRQGREQYILEHPQDAADIKSLVATRL